VRLMLGLLVLTALPALAQLPAGASRCAIGQMDGDQDYVAADRFTEVGPLPESFSVGLVRMGDDFAISDRHQDQIFVFGADGETRRMLSYPSYEPAGLSYDGKLLVCADGGNNRIYFLDPETDECVRTIESPLSGISAVACNEKGQLWIAGRGQSELQLIDPLDGTTLADIKSPTTKIGALAFDKNGYLWAADASRDQIFLIDIRTGYTIFRLAAPGPVCNGLWLDGDHLYASDYQTDTLYRTKISGLHGETVRSDARKGRVTLFCDLQNLGPGEVTGGTLVLAVPEDGPNQALEEVWCTEGARDEADQWDQKVKVYDVPRLAAGEMQSVRLGATGEFYRISTKIFPHMIGKLDAVPKDIRKRYLVDEDKYRVQGEYIQNKVKSIVGDETNPYFMARKLYDFLIGRINYQMIGGWDIAPTVIERGTGSCSEYTFSYIALCRAVGIPARYVGALVLRGEDSSVDTAFHRWAEIYLPTIGWIPVDVNAGDKELQGDRCFSFGGIANRFLITTRGGGASEWLNWGYDLETAYRTKGKANVRVEQFAEWDVVE
jgi:DNA-binding beta-propeller fold protein YncE